MFTAPFFIEFPVVMLNFVTVRSHHRHRGHGGFVFLLDRETTIQQKPAALRAVNKVISSNKHLSAKSRYKVG